jgi:PAS domain S-box-containing protein
MNKSQPIQNLRRAAGLVMMLIVIYSAVVSWYSWTDEKVNSVSTLTTVAELEAKAIDSYLAHLESELKGLGEDLTQGADRIDLAKAYSLVKKFRERHPELFNVTLLEPDGNVLLTAKNPPDTVRATLAKEVSFMAFLDELKQGKVLGIGQPLVAVVSKVAIVPVRYAITDRQGNLSYIVSANLTHEYLRANWVEAPITTKAAIGLISDKGFLLSRYPVPQNLSLAQIYGRPRTGALIHYLQANRFPRQGYVQGESSLDGPDMLTIFRRLPSYPVTLFVAMPMSEIRLVWIERMGATWLAMCFMFLGGFLSYRYVLRRQQIWDLEQNRLQAHRQRQEIELQASETRFKTMFIEAPMGIALIDSLTGQIYAVNPKFAGIAGRTVQEMTHIDWMSITHPDDVQQDLDKMARLNAGKIAGFQMEKRYLHQDGTHVWINMTIAPIAVQDKAKPRHLCMIEDITGRKLAEDALRESENRFHAMADSAPVLIWVSGEDKLCSWFNKVWLDFTGRSMEQEMGNGWAEGVLSDDFKRCLNTYVTSFDARQEFSMEYRLRRFDGDYRWLLATGVPRCDAQGVFLGYIGSCIDITDRKTAAAERNRLSKIIEDAPDFIAMSDMQAHLKYLNIAGARLVGLADDVDLTDLEIRDMHPLWATRRVLDEGVPAVLQHGFWHGETALLHRDGHETPVSQMLLLHRDEAGNPEYLSTIMRDISELKNHERALKLAKDEAQAANVAKSRFLATMSHEIRTPMNGVLGMAQLLLRPGLDEDKRLDYAHTLISNGQALMTLLNDILDLSRIEAGKFQLEVNVFEPVSALRETCALFSGAAQTRNLQLDYQWHGPLRQLYRSDTYRLRQMLFNLIGNAIKFTSQGSVRTEGIELERDGETALLEFSVSDTGIGIAPEKLDLLFKPFSQADDSMTRQFGGTGLGLSIVSNLARAMGGEVGVQSSEAKGSRFWFRVRAQLVLDEAEDEPGEVSTLTDTTVIHALARLRGQALVVEDNPANRLVIESMLDLLGVTFKSVTDGQQAVDAIMQGARPNVVLMDLHMPVMGGYAATERIRQFETENNRPRVPIIALTADAFEAVHQRCLAVGMDEFLTKPIRTSLLHSTLSKWLPAVPESAMNTSPSATALRKVDRDQFAALVAELMPLLEQNKFAGFACFKKLQNLVAGTEMVPEFQAMDARLKDLRFDLVLEHLRLLATHYLESNPSS